MNPDGTMARMKDLRKFSQEHDMRIISVVDLIKYRLHTERFIRRLETLPFESEYGSFELYVYENQLDGNKHLAFVKGDLESDSPVMVRVHTESILKDVFASTLQDQGHELKNSLRMIERTGRGVLVYLRLNNKETRLMKEVEVHLHHRSYDPDHTSFKDFGIGAQIIADLGIHDIRLLTNHPKRLAGLEGFDINIVEQIPIEPEGLKIGAGMAKTD
jgi:3,4-dihydroxy 2-butanone 4-phosphate synthase/GTP cyclohydrolase II